MLRWVQLLGGGTTVILQASTRDLEDDQLLAHGWSRVDLAGGPPLLEARRTLDAASSEHIADLTVQALQATPVGLGSPNLRISDTAYRPAP